MLSFLEYFRFIVARRKLWLAPIMIVLLIFGMVIIGASNPTIAPFIYTLF